jgi:hypothetical protein
MISATTSASFIIDTDFITPGKLDNFPGLAGNFLDDMQLFTASSLMAHVRPHSRYEQQQRCVVCFLSLMFVPMFSAP